jgi:hypothetical protein
MHVSDAQKQKPPQAENWLMKKPLAGSLLNGSILSISLRRQMGLHGLAIVFPPHDG